MTDRKEIAAKAIRTIFGQGEEEDITQCFSPDWEGVYPFDQNTTTGYEGIRTLVARHLRAFTTSKVTIRKQLETPSTVVTEWSVLSVHNEGMTAEDNGLNVDLFDPTTGKIKLSFFHYR